MRSIQIQKLSPPHRRAKPATFDKPGRPKSSSQKIHLRVSNGSSKKEAFKSVIAVSDFIYQIGEFPALRMPSKPVDISKLKTPEYLAKIKYMKSCLKKYRKLTGKGRAIAAVQLGFPEEMIVVYNPEIKGETFMLINPVITKKSKELLPHLFYLLKNDNKRIAITKDDTITHYSADKMSKYLNKILWRIKNNIYHVKDMGAAGFTGRQIYEQKGQTFKKYLFLPYAFTIILPLFDSLYLCVSRKNNVYLIHLPLTIFTALMISYHLIIRSMGKNRPLKSYDETFEIS